jgi:hypothetical protein
VGRSGNNAPLVTVAAGGTLNLESVVIMDNTNSGDGGGVAVQNGGTLTMDGGTISSNQASNGGGVAVQDGGTFTMNGGTITNNTAGTNGGGVSVTGANAQFTADGGTVSDNRADNGGGIYLGESEKPISISNVNIRNNTARDSGGGIFIFIDSTLLTQPAMTDSFVTANSAVNGGGVYVCCASSQARTFTMTRGDISGNTARNQGGGVFVQGTNLTTYRTSFNMVDGTIRANTAPTAGGAGVYLHQYATLGMDNSAQVSQNNPVHFFDDKAKIVITGVLGINPAANIELEGSNFTSGTTYTLLLGNYLANHAKFLVNGVSGKILADGKYTVP